jgi:hypothetical protein
MELWNGVRVSELIASTEFRFGRVVGEMATVPTGMAKGVTGHRNGYEFRVWAPDTTTTQPPHEEGGRRPLNLHIRNSPCVTDLRGRSTRSCTAAR